MQTDPAFPPISAARRFFRLVDDMLQIGNASGNLLQLPQGNELACAGSVGTGFTESVARTLRKDLDAIQQDTPPIKVKEKRIVWVDPILVAEVEYRGWTGEDILRHASYKGLRDGADAAEVFRR